jgi:hypothetical protein
MIRKFYYGSILFILMMTANCFAQDTIFMRNDQHIPCNVVEVTSTEVKYKKLELSEGPLYIENKSMVAQIKYKNGYVDVFTEVKLPPAKKTEDDYVQDRKRTKSRSDDDYVQKPRREKLIMISNGIYIYGDSQLNEKQMWHMLLSLKDPQITEEVEGAKRAKRFKYLGFLAIPLGIGSVVCLAQALTEEPGNTNQPPPDNSGYLAPAAVCAVGAAATFGSSIYFGIDRKRRNARAVHLYQQKYGGQ